LNLRLSASLFVLLGVGCQTTADLTPTHMLRLICEGADDSFRQSRIAVSKARGLPENAQSCKLSILDFDTGHHRVTHDCRAVPGQSGSPITRLSNGEHMLVGLHIGHLWMFKSPETGRPDRKGYINLLDKPTIDEIESLITAHRS